MANLNGKGPQNEGPGTGRRQGYCFSNLGSGLGRRNFGSKGFAGQGRGNFCRRWTSDETLSSTAGLNTQADNNLETLKSQRDFFASRLKELDEKLAEVN